MSAIIVTVWLSCLHVISGSDKATSPPAYIFIKNIELQEGNRSGGLETDGREIQKLVDATKDIPLPVNCAIRYEVRPKR